MKYGFGLLVVGGLLACSERSEPAIDCSLKLSWVNYATMANQFFNHCTSCHSSQLASGEDRSYAPIDINYDSFAAARASAEAARETTLGLLMPPGAALNANLMPASTACLIAAWVYADMPN